MTLTPMPPMPNTTTVEPGWTPATLRTEPNPVVTAQPTTAAVAKGISSGTSTSWSARTQTSSANDDTAA